MNLSERVNVTREEIKLVELHMEHFSPIKKENITSVWRDKQGYLCVMYDTERCGEVWFHYNAELGEWW